MNPEGIAAAASALASAEAVLIGAGAGMGVDSGLPDFRGDRGFWKAYPPYERLGLSFVDMANPRWFVKDPAFAWGFYGHRRNLYRATRPHAGFALLRRWCAQRDGGGFVFTSNVDGQFQRAGFVEAQVLECHGSLEWDQCLAECGASLFPADPAEVTVGPDMRAVEPLPACPQCGALARPNILMFGDGGWDPRREVEQAHQMERWLRGLRGASLVVIELGAGSAVPTVRAHCEGLASIRPRTQLVRINPREGNVPRGGIGLEASALAALQALEAAEA